LLFIVFVLFYEVCRGQLFAQTGQILLRSEKTSNHEVKLSNIQFPFRGSRYSSLYVSTIRKETFGFCTIMRHACDNHLVQYFLM